MEKKDRKAERSARKGARKIKRLGKKITRQQIRADKKSEASATIVEKRNASQKKIRGLMDNQPPNTTLKQKHNNFTTKGLGKGKMTQGGGPSMAPSNVEDDGMRLSGIQAEAFFTSGTKGLKAATERYHNTPRKREHPKRMKRLDKAATDRVHSDFIKRPEIKLRKQTPKI